MLFDQIRALLAMPHKRALLRLQRLLRGQTTLLLSTALVEAGVARALREWRSLDEIVEASGAKRDDYLRHVLELGVSLGMIRARRGRYRARSALLRATTAADGVAIESLLREFTHYHGQLLRELPQQIAGARPPDYLERYGDLVAGASRIVEPFLEPFADEIARSGHAKRILEIGCGTGVYLRRYGLAHPGHHGIAVDLDPTVVTRARENVVEWGIADRFEVHHADIRQPGPEFDGPFDLITSFQNVYYFDDHERLELFRNVRRRLARGGAFALVSVMSGEGFLFRYYDVLLNGTAGCHSFPMLEAVLGDLESAGLSHVERSRLLSGPGVAALIARADS